MRLSCCCNGHGRRRKTTFSLYKTTAPFPADYCCFDRFGPSCSSRVGEKQRCAKTETDLTQYCLPIMPRLPWAGSKRGMPAGAYIFSKTKGSACGDATTHEYVDFRPRKPVFFASCSFAPARHTLGAKTERKRSCRGKASQLIPLVRARARFGERFVGSARRLGERGLVSTYSIYVSPGTEIGKTHHLLAAPSSHVYPEKTAYNTLTIAATYKQIPRVFSVEPIGQP